MPKMCEFKYFLLSCKELKILHAHNFNSITSKVKVRELYHMTSPKHCELKESCGKVKLSVDSTYTQTIFNTEHLML